MVPIETWPCDGGFQVSFCPRRSADERSLEGFPGVVKAFSIKSELLVDKPLEAEVEIMVGSDCIGEAVVACDNPDSAGSPESAANPRPESMMRHTGICIPMASSWPY